jgi:hypothetical protein
LETESEITRDGHAVFSHHRHACAAI